MKNKRLRNSLLTSSASLIIVALMLFTFARCHQKTAQFEILYYEQNQHMDTNFLVGFDTALANETHNLHVTKTKTEIINPNANTKYIMGNYKDKAATLALRDDVTYINSFYDPIEVAVFRNTNHLHAAHTFYAEKLLNEVNDHLGATAFVTDESFFAETFIDYYETTPFAMKLLLPSDVTNYTDDVTLLLNANITNIVLALSAATFTPFLYYLSVSSFTGKLFLADFSLQSDLSIPDVFFNSSFTLHFLTPFSFNHAIPEHLGIYKYHEILMFYCGFAAGKLVLMLEKTASTTLRSDVFITEVNLLTGPTTLASFMYERH